MGLIFGLSSIRAALNDVWFQTSVLNEPSTSADVGQAAKKERMRDEESLNEQTVIAKETQKDSKHEAKGSISSLASWFLEGKLLPCMQL